jgi:predicted MFS family arabinose efflux permease
LLCAAALGLLGYALIEQSHYSWASPQIYGTLLAGVTAFTSFIIYEAQSVEPMLPLSLFTVRNFWIGNIATAAIYAGLSVSTFLVVIFVQQVGGYSAIKAGLALMPITVIMFLLSPRFGALSGRFGPRIFMTVGPLLAGSGFLYMLRVSQPIHYTTQLLPGILLFGFGLATTVAPLTSAILGSIAKERSGIASAINNAVARIAGLVAIAAIGLVTGPHLNLIGFHRGVMLTASLLMFGGLVSLAGIRTSSIGAR